MNQREVEDNYLPPEFSLPPDDGESGVFKFGYFVREGGREGAGKSGKRRKSGRLAMMRTREQAEAQRMTHIAVERNRRRQMNDHLLALRSLMPTSYIQRGDQASVIGGAIEFVRELEQLLQCLESQKRRRQCAGGGGHDPSAPLPLPAGSEGLCEEISEAKSPLGDVEVQLLGVDAAIKILSRRRAGQLLRIITAFEDLQLTILHANITTIEHTVLYSFNVKITAEMSCTAKEMANSVQQILGFTDSS